jgi:hypothetical protein
LRLDNLRRKADPEALAKLDLFLAMCIADPLEIGFTIDAKTVHALFEIKEPFGLWRSRKLTHLKEFKDYARANDKWLLSPDSAMIVAMGNPGKLGALYAYYVACAVCERTEGRSPLEVFEEAHRYADEIARLDRMME